MKDIELGHYSAKLIVDHSTKECFTVIFEDEEPVEDIGILEAMDLYLEHEGFVDLWMEETGYGFVFCGSVFDDEEEEDDE